MSFVSRLIDFAQLTAQAWRQSRSVEADDESMWRGSVFSAPSITGISVNQVTALNAAAVMACVTMIAEDVAKLPWGLFRRRPDGGRDRVDDHPLSPLLEEPNDWQDDLEFREMLQVGLLLRGNGYAVKIRNGRGIPVMLVPMNPDRVALWEAPGGELFYRVIPMGLHERAMLKDEPFLIPFDDVLHIRGFSMNGLMGASRIALAKEAVGLTLAQEQQAARWMGQGARPSGMFTTDAKLSEDAAKRLAVRIRETFSGLQNSGKIMVGEQGLKYAPFAMTSADLEFIASRQFQLAEIARIFRVPPHMIGELSRSTNNNIVQQAQEYANYTISGYTVRWKRKFGTSFGLNRDNIFLDFDLSELIRADLVSRFNQYRTGVMSMVLTPNEARIDDGRNPLPGGDELQKPMNMAAAGSQSTGTAADDGGRPAEGELK